MRRLFVVTALVAVFVLGLASIALATTVTGTGTSPTVINPAAPAYGRSMWTYQDLHDAAAKYQGGYAAWDSVTGLYPNNEGGSYTLAGPHGGYDSTTNKCKVCHAVHRAEGAYYLLRADRQDDACSYCHIGSAPYSDKTVYDLNPDGIYTTNGHTIGADMTVPDSSISQWAVSVEISSTNGAALPGDTWAPITETIHVRSYDEQEISMYRFSRHHSQSPSGASRSGFVKVGPLALRCMNCHQPHNAKYVVWRPLTYVSGYADPATQTVDYRGQTVDAGGFLSYGYKLLRRFPSATTTGLPNGYTLFGADMWNATMTAKVPETTLTAGTNYSNDYSMSLQYTENGFTGRTPIWIAQGFSSAGTGPAEDAATINNFTLSAWCADCHNLNIGGAEELANPELGFKAHQERTHAAPFTGAHSGPGQCYSCHRDDLSVSMKIADPVGYGRSTTARGKADSCSQCHYGTTAYAQDHNFDNAGGSWPAGYSSDFPHSGLNSDIKLLGSYTTTPAVNSSWVPAYYQKNITENNLDAVCIRCHPGVGVHN